jgi:hypothetical protein
VRRSTLRTDRGLGLIIAAAVALSGCASSPITPPRIEGSVERTFANLVQIQVTWLGLPAMAASDFDVTANCKKLSGATVGSGEWLCTLVWKGPERQTLRDAYDLFVATDGCYTAMVAGESLGGPTLKAKDGRDVRNLLYAFDGCFDTT